MDKKYFQWLLEFVGSRNNPRDFHNCRRMLEMLYRIPYTWVKVMDGSRADDGLYLRKMYGEEIKEINPGCTVLEMLVMLAYRCDIEYIGNPRNPRPDFIFFQMLRNLHLMPSFCERRTSEFTQDICQVVQLWMDEDYEPNGEGSIFVFHNPDAPEDIRELTIWDQMVAYTKYEL